MCDPILRDAFALVADPHRTEQLGRQAAAALAESGADLILVDPDIGSALLGHVVARELGTGAAVVSVDLGVIEVDPPLPEAATVALVSRDAPTYPTLPALCYYLTAHGHRVVGIVSGTPVPQGEDLPVPPVVLQA